MKVDIPDSAALRAIEPGAVRAYLDVRGWHHVEPYGQHGDVYAREDAPEIIAPTETSLRDYPARIAEIVSILATVEDRDALRIYRDLTTAAADLIRVRAPEAEDDGAVSLERGVALVSGARDLLLAAACASVRPAAAFRSGAVREAVDYLRGVQLGQTERGSFVVTMQSPVPKNLSAREPDLLGDMTYAEPEVPFSRRVTCRLVTSLHALKAAVVESDRSAAGIEAFRSQVPSGVSANLCDAAARLATAGGGVDVALSWALTRPVDAGHAALSRVMFTKRDAGTLQQAADLLRDREPRLDERIQGVVVKMSTGATRRQVTLKATIDGVPASVSVEPREADHDAFVEAYKYRHDVIVRGELRRIGQRWALEDPRGVTVVPQAVEDGEDLVDLAG